MTWAAVAIGGAAAIGAGSNALQGQATNRAARKARDYNARATGDGAQRVGDLVYGGGGWENAVKSSVAAQGGDWRSSNIYADRLNNQIGGSLVNQSDAIIGMSNGDGIQSNFAKQTGDLMSLSGGHADYLRGLYGGNTNTLLGNMRVGDQGLLSAYDQGARGVQSDANAFGQGRESVINRDAQKSARATDQATSARLAASGFGGSTAGLQMRAGNARNVEDARQGQLQNLHDAQASARLGTSQNLLAGRMGLMTGQQNLQNQALAGRLGAQENSDSNQLNAYQNRAYDRASQGTQLAENGLNRSIQARASKIGLLNNTAQSSALNPQLGQNALGYYPGVSSAGQSGISAGNSLGALGGYLLANQNKPGGSQNGFQGWGGQMNQMQMMG